MNENDVNLLPHTLELIYATGEVTTPTIVSINKGSSEY
jgi:hypothetical protein